MCARSSSRVSASSSRQDWVSRSSCSLLVIVVPHLLLCCGGVALQLLNSFVGDQTFHTEPGYSDGNEDKPEHHGAAADNCSRLGGAHSVLLQGPDRSLKQDHQRWDE